MRILSTPFAGSEAKQDVKTHELKILPEFYAQVLSGNKKWELRKNDRDFKVGDRIILKEWTDEKEFTGREYEARILYVFHGGRYGLEEGYCIFSFG